MTDEGNKGVVADGRLAGQAEWAAVCQDAVSGILDAVLHELFEAQCKHRPMHSAHEAYAVILEELQEYWQAVMGSNGVRDYGAMRRELISVAAMAIRAVLDVMPTQSKPK